MEKVGSMTVEVITSGKTLRLKVHAKPYNHESPATEEELLALSAYLERELMKLQDQKERK